MGHPDISEIAVMWYDFKAIIWWLAIFHLQWNGCFRWQGLQGNEKEVGVKILSSGEIMKASNLQIFRKREGSPYTAF